MKKILGLLGGLMLTLTLLAAPGVQSTASAATAECKGVGWPVERGGDMDKGAYQLYVPVVSNSNRSYNCQRGQTTVILDASYVLQESIDICYGWKSKLGVAGVDGVYGYNTMLAMKSVQSKVGVTADGVYGKNTHNKMLFVADYGFRLCGYAPVI